MKVLLTGATGYIGRRLLPVLWQSGHQITCVVRDPRRLDLKDLTHQKTQLPEVVAADLLDAASLEALPKNIDVVFYLVHSMSSSYLNFSKMEHDAASNFATYIKSTTAKQVIYISGIANDEQLSRHLQSRKKVEEVLATSGVPLTVLRAAIIIGSGGASFEMLRDLVEKLPVMITPKWVKSRCQPIAIRNVINYLTGVMGNENTYHQTYDIGGSDILSYREMLLEFAKVRGLKRYLITVPFFSPNLSSYWLYFVTATSYSLGRSLVESLHNDVICQDNRINEVIPQKLYSYREALEMAFTRIAQNEVVSSWTDTLSGPIRQDFLDFVQVPKYGCLTDVRTYSFDRPIEEVLDNIWAIGGQRGWYFGNWLWALRGLLDKMFGGVGLRRGRRSPEALKTGDALDFWRVLLADRTQQRLLLYAEMKLPGEAWLEFQVKNDKDSHHLVQKATFRPKGLWGRLYWYMVLPFHFFIFPGMAKRIISFRNKTTSLAD